MRVDVMIETIFQNVQGMKPSTDSSVKRVDIKAYLPAAINYAMNEKYYIGLQTERDTGSLPKLFVATYEDLEVKRSEERALSFVEMPAEPIALPNDSGIEMVSAMQGKVSYYPMRNQHQLSGYERFTGGNTGYWIEGKRIYFNQISPLVKSVLVRMTASVDDLKPDDRVPVPAGMEANVIQMCVDYFVRGRGLPQDDIVNNVDDVNQRIEQ